jgi:hypothetical protein
MAPRASGHVRRVRASAKSWGPKAKVALGMGAGLREPRAEAACQGIGHCGPLRRSADTRCRVTPKLLAISSIVRPSA